MSPWLLSFILAMGVAAPIDDAPHEEAVVVYRCAFDESADQNFDGWPDGWSRLRGPGYPPFLPIEIVPRARGDEAALRMRLDGGAATIYSPHIPISPLFSYRLDGWIRTEGLTRNFAHYSLRFYDADGRLLEAHDSKHFHQQETWTPLVIGPVMASHPDTHTAVIGLHLRPRAGEPGDLRGAAYFDHVSLSRLPRVLLRSPRPHNLFAAPGEVEIICEVSGVLQPHPLVQFTLEDVSGRTLAEFETPLVADKASAERAPPALRDDMPQRDGGDSPLLHGFAGHASWKPPVTDYGHYRVRATLADSEATRIERTMTLAVMRPIKPAERGEFGWSLPDGDERLTLAELVGLVSHAGIHWLKFPMWYGEEDPSRPDRLAWFADRASGHRVTVIGVLDRPPPSLLKNYGEAADLPVATLFVEAPLWQPAVDPVMTRLSLKVRWWQLGGDRDHSFVGFPRLPEKIAEIKQYFLKYGQEVQVGLSWPWLCEATAGPWDFLSRTATPSLTAAETAAYLPTAAPAQATPWMTLTPLDREHYDLDTRARDLVERMLIAKIHRAQGIFLPDPFDPRHGVLHSHGAPAELFLPWRTTALLLGGAEYIGAIELPGGSTNHLFQRGAEGVMVVWNRHPTEETLYLGGAIEHFDLWGRRIEHHTRQHGAATEQTLAVGPLPTFVTGLNVDVARWRVALAFENRHLPSVFGRDQTVRYRFSNTFPQGVGGEVRLSGPADWEIAPPRVNFRAAEGEIVKERFDVRFKSDAQSGPQLLRLDFTLTADQNYVFSTYQRLHVGIGDVEIETATRLNEQGDLVVEQTFINQTDDFVSFNCQLFAPGRRRDRVQVMNLGRGRHTAAYVLPRGEELLGETLLLRAEELDGDRVLNYRIVPHH